MISISNEQLLIAVIGLLFAAGYMMRRWADSNLVRANTDLEEVKSDAATISSVMTALEKQIEINQQNATRDAARERRWRKMMLRERTARQEGYNVIRGVQNDTNTVLTNLYNAVLNQPQAIVSAVNESIAVTTGAAVAQMREASLQEMKVLVGELGEVLRQKFALDRFAQEEYRFPAADDPDWRDEWITPLMPNVVMYRGPYFDADAPLKKTCARIKEEGEQVKLIIGRYTDWLVVKKIDPADEGDMACWGYIPAHKVRVGLESKVLAKA